MQPYYGKAARTVRASTHAEYFGQKTFAIGSKMLPYHFTVKYKRGSENTVADYLSRSN